jgi:hypothetical protein
MFVSADPDPDPHQNMDLQHWLKACSLGKLFPGKSM